VGKRKASYKRFYPKKDLGHGGVNDKADIGFVDTHAKRRGGTHNVNFAVSPALVRLLVERVLV